MLNLNWLQVIETHKNADDVNIVNTENWLTMT